MVVVSCVCVLREIKSMPLSVGRACPSDAPSADLSLSKSSFAYARSSWTPLSAVSGNATGEADQVTIESTLQHLRKAAVNLRVENASLRARASRADAQDALINALRLDNMRLREQMRLRAESSTFDAEHVRIRAPDAPTPEVSTESMTADDDDDIDFYEDKENCSPEGGERPHVVPPLTESSALRVFNVLEERPMFEAGSDYDTEDEVSGADDDEAEADVLGRDLARRA